jgi:hypothetical protein
MFVHANYSIVTQSLTSSLSVLLPNNGHTVSCNQLLTFANYQVFITDHSNPSTLLFPPYNT